MTTTGGQRGERYFFIMALILIAIVASGFGPSFLNQSTDDPLPILLYVHGAVFGAWFVLFAVQASLIGAGNVRLHMRLGAASIILAGTMVTLAVLVMKDAFAHGEFSIAGMSAETSMMFPVTDIVNFVIVYGLALTMRKTAPAHKRLMLMAGLLMIDPAVARLTIHLGAPAPVILLIELGLFASLIVYDLRTLRRAHWVSLLGLGLYIAALALKFTVAQTPWWAAFVTRVFG